jgi:hypothetical protein
LSNGFGHDDAKQPRNSLTCPIPDQTERSSVTTDLALSLFSRWLLDLIYSRLIYFESKHDCRSNKLYLFLWSGENFTCLRSLHMSVAGCSYCRSVENNPRHWQPGSMFHQIKVLRYLHKHSYPTKCAYDDDEEDSLSLSLSSLVKIGTKPPTI